MHCASTVVVVVVPVGRCWRDDAVDTDDAAAVDDEDAEVIMGDGIDMENDDSGEEDDLQYKVRKDDDINCCRNEDDSEDDTNK